MDEKLKKIAEEVRLAVLGQEIAELVNKDQEASPEDLDRTRQRNRQDGQRGFVTTARGEHDPLSPAPVFSCRGGGF